MTASKSAKARVKVKARPPTKPTNPTPLRARARKAWEDRFLAALRVGYTRRRACRVAEINRSTFYDRIASDAAFLAAVEDAEDEGLVFHEHNLRKAAPKDWRASAFVLERRAQAEWGRKQEIEHSGSVGVGVIAPDLRIEAMKTDPEQAETLRKFLDALASKQ